DLLLPRLQAQVSAHLPALTGGVRLVPAGLGLDVGDYAAMALVV
ncbi:MAG TPA: ROK family protein, partial [Burkholderiaceae bacterium]